MGDSVECEKSLVHVRKSTGPTAIDVTCVNGSVLSLYKYKGKRSSAVKIVQELDPKQSIVSATSYLDQNDSIEGDTIEIYTGRLLNFKVKANFSHVHGMQESSIPEFTYAKIEIPWEFVLQRRLA